MRVRHGLAERRVEAVQEFADDDLGEIAGMEIAQCVLRAEAKSLQQGIPNVETRFEMNAPRPGCRVHLVGL
jgi:hypothetical protein